MDLFAHSDRHDFDMTIVLAALENCPTGDADVDLRQYLVAYKELCRFFTLTGRLFAFVARDLQDKIGAIEVKQKGDQGHHYTSAEEMLKFELGCDTTVHKGSTKLTHSGTRTLLRLHWSLEFILEFMSRISKCSDHDKTAKIASKVYEQTLSKHQPWITRKMAAIAVYFLPSRKDLIQVMCKQDYETVLKLLDKVVHAGRIVYDLIEKMYSDNNILDIP